MYRFSERKIVELKRYVVVVTRVLLFLLHGDV
jgi:hypothetical protein